MNLLRKDTPHIFDGYF